MAGIDLWHFWLSLVLLGLGWNFGFIGSTALFTETYRLSEKGKVQGFHDFVLFGSVALSSLFAGKVLDDFGWNTVNGVIFPVVLHLPCGAGRADIFGAERACRLTIFACASGKWPRLRKSRISIDTNLPRLRPILDLSQALTHKPRHIACIRVSTNQAQ